LSTHSINVAGIPWEHRPDVSSKQVRERLSPAALRGFFRVMKHWKVRDEDARVLLGGISNGTFYKLKQNPSTVLAQDQLIRISLLIGIFKALNILYSRDLADAWVQLRNSNPMFGGRAPLSFLLQGQPAMMRVRQLLDARRGGL
jgi:hypothetical protein